MISAVHEEDVQIFPTKKTDHFTIIENVVLRNKKLSFRARGILCHLLSHKARGWKVRMSELQCGEGDNVEGEFAIRSGVDELIAAGHMTRERVRNPAGHLTGWRYCVYEDPITETDSPSPGQTSPGQPRPKKTIGKEDQRKESEVGSLRSPTGAAADGSSDVVDSGWTEEELASMRASEAPEMRLESEDEAQPVKGLPWGAIEKVMRRTVPQLAIPPRAARRNGAMTAFWRKFRTLGAFEQLATKMQESDFLMARNGWTGSGGRPYSWSWVFSRKPGESEYRYEKILADFYANERMMKVKESSAKSEAKAAQTEIRITGVSAAATVDLKETFLRDGVATLRWRFVKTHVSGLPEYMDERP